MKEEAPEQTIASRVKFVRELKGLRQGDIANMLGLSLRGYQKIERNEGLPGSDALLKFRVLDINPGWVLTGEGEMRLNGSDCARLEPSSTGVTLQQSATSTLDAKLLGGLSNLCAAEHKKHGINLAGPALTIATIEIYNNIASRVVDMNDKAAVEAMIPVAIKELGERLEEAKDEPGTGKRLA